MYTGGKWNRTAQLPPDRETECNAAKITKSGYSESPLLNTMNAQLADKKCIPCRGGTPPLHGAELEKLHASVPDWEVVDERQVRREFRFPDFAKALEFVNRVGAVAEEQGHHPDILLAWGKVGITLWTHSINGLTESDFIMAAKIDRLARP